MKEQIKLKGAGQLLPRYFYSSFVRGGNKMRKYETLHEELYHQNTLYGLLDIKPSRNNIFKSMLVTKIENGTVHIECEPYDDSYSPEKADRVLRRRKNFIFDSLNVDCISATFYDEWTAKYGTLIKRGDSMK